MNSPVADLVLAASALAILGALAIVTVMFAAGIAIGMLFSRRR